MTKIMIGAPVRNRAWTLSRYCSALHYGNLEKYRIPYESMFLVNDCFDASGIILRDWEFNTITFNFDDKRTMSERRAFYSYYHLASLRNKLLDFFLWTDCTHFFSCDSDIIIPDGSLKQLIDDDLPVVSMLIRNSDTRPDNHNVLMKDIRNHEGNIMARHMPLAEIERRASKNNGIMECDLTGAVYLIKREVIEAGCRYAKSDSGEDEPFCDAVKANGFKLYCDTRLRPIHAYSENLDLEV